MKLSEAQLPFRDRPVQLFSLTSWVQMVLGVLMLLVVFTFVQPLWVRLQGLLAPAMGRVGAIPTQAVFPGQHIERANDPVTPVISVLN